MSETRAFLAGPRAYGAPRADSDIDIVIFTDNDTRKKLIELSRATQGHGIVLDNVNIIAITDRKQFSAWPRGFKRLMDMAKRAPVGRAQAIDVFTESGVNRDLSVSPGGTTRGS